ncbi:hypothetical protein V6N13_098298 [Hibiscus sabdariffa]
MGRRQIGRSVDQITLSLRHVYRQSSIAPFLSDAASASIPTASPSILPASRIIDLSTWGASNEQRQLLPISSHSMTHFSDRAGFLFFLLLFSLTAWNRKGWFQILISSSEKQPTSWVWRWSQEKVQVQVALDALVPVDLCGKFAVTGLLGSTTLEDYMMNLTRNATLLALVALQKDESGESYSFDQWQQ